MEKKYSVRCSYENNWTCKEYSTIWMTYSCGPDNIRKRVRIKHSCFNGLWVFPRDVWGFLRERVGQSLDERPMSMKELRQLIKATNHFNSESWDEDMRKYVCDWEYTGGNFKKLEEKYNNFLGADKNIITTIPTEEGTEKAVFTDSEQGKDMGVKVKDERKEGILKPHDENELESIIKERYERMIDGHMDLTDVDVSNVDNLNWMFKDLENLVSLDVSNWDVSKVDRMEKLFSGCKNLQHIDVSQWDVSLVEEMGDMFFDCESLQSLDISNWDVSKVTGMSGMFSGCKNLQSLDLSRWNVSNVGCMLHMFSRCEKLQSLDISNWDVSSVFNMSCMFCECRNLQTLDLSKWDVSHVYDMSFMFSNCHNLITLNISNWHVSQLEDMQHMFEYCYKLQDRPKWK